MPLNTGWEHFELEKEIGNSNIAQLLEIFKREDAQYKVMCKHYVSIYRASGNNIEAPEVQAVKRDCEHLEVSRLKVSLIIAQRLTDTERIQNQVYPNKEG